MALKPEILKWFYEVQKQLKERFDLDTSRKEDMGRLKKVQLYTMNETGERVPLGDDEPIIDLAAMTTDISYATPARTEDGTDYAEPVPRSSNDRLDWTQRVQRTFRVTAGEDGTFAMQSDMSDEELMRFYNDAKQGRLLANKPGGDVRANNGSGMFLCVGKDGMPVFCDTCFDNMLNLNFEQVEKLYQNHPELLDRPLNDIDAQTAARIELTDLNRLENPGMIYDRIEASVQGIQNASTDEEITWWDRYENLAMRQLHADITPATYRQFSMTNRTLCYMMSRRDIPNDFLMGENLDKFMVADENGVMPLFPDYKELKKQIRAGDPYAEATLQRRLGEAGISGKLIHFEQDPENPGQYKGFRVMRDEDGQLNAEDLPTEKPTLPWYKRWFSIFFRADVAKYNKDKAAYECYEKLKPVYEMVADTASQTEEEEPEQEEVLDPEKAARKAAEKEKLEKMTPEQRFEYDVASQVVDIYHKPNMSARIYLKMYKVTADDVQKDPGFREFMQSEKMQAAMDKKLHGTEAEKKKIFSGILAQDYIAEVARKVKESAKAPAAGNAAPKAPTQDAPAQDANQKKVQTSVMGGH